MSARWALWFLAMIWKQEGRLPPEMIQGVTMTFFQMMMLAALSIFFSTFATPVVNFFLSFGLFLIGNLSSVTDSLTTNRNIGGQLASAKRCIICIPNFGNFNIQNQIIHPTSEIQNMAQYIQFNIVYAIVYSLVLLMLAVFIFDRREV